MSAFLEHYQFLARYNRWMNQRLYAVCDALTDAQRKTDRGAFFKSIHHTLTHLVWADKMWLARFTRQGIHFEALLPELLAMSEGSSFTSDLHPDWEDLKSNRDRLDVAIELWLVEMSPNFLTTTLRYANTKGVARTHPAWQALTHFFNHQTHHRGQVTILLAQAGVDVDRKSVV